MKVGVGVNQSNALEKYRAVQQLDFPSNIGNVANLFRQLYGARLIKKGLPSPVPR
ncbi:hypothetical protein [Lacticaseibacillus paracasei]|uniref:hypothetical protein n=1 Tax=Lacticaseibacillus paracasei TaxID=1597 RepID=UPI003CF81DBF